MLILTKLDWCINIFPWIKKPIQCLKRICTRVPPSWQKLQFYSALKGDFWRINDYLFHYSIDHGAIYLKEISEQTGLSLNALKDAVYGEKVKKALQNYIISGLRLNITATPSYLINGTVYTGQIPPTILKAIER